ncbi:UNVERIFIED_CONTAM: hypothetical protein PYX00_003983 [Menopon gallinae]|uniref:Lysosomal acid phosphatase n=1 Tax=Menopon gallinae TaxID=328185 RepID=A0AAW2I226_9NEOP
MARPGLKRCMSDRKGVIVFTSILIVIISIIFLSYVAFGQSSVPDSSLQLVSVVFRHGDRTPTESYPNSPYSDGSPWNQNWGALTKLGMQQMYSLGMNLRKRYSHFLREMYSPNDMYIVSSDHDRCLMSAQLCLAGLYPPVGDQLWNPDLRWQPIPVHTIPRQLDQLIVMRKPCPAYNTEFNKTYSSSYVKKIDSDNSDLYKYLTEKSGAQINSILSLESLYNTLEIEERNNLKLPEWTKSVYPEKMKDIAALSLALFTFTDKQKRLKGGPLVGDIAQHISQKVLNTLKPNRQLFLYSGHDLNLVSTFRVLGFPELRKPENGAALIFELHKGDSGEHYVQVRH